MSGRKKINAELYQITGPTEEATMQRRTEWIQHRGSRIQFLKELREKGLKGKDYSDAVAEYDAETRFMSWNRNYGGNV